MTYATGRVIHDADSHVMEPADWLVAFADEPFKERLLRRERAAASPPSRAPEKVHRGPDRRAQGTLRLWRLAIRRNASGRSTNSASPASWCSRPRLCARSAPATTRTSLYAGAAGGQPGHGAVLRRQAAARRRPMCRSTIRPGGRGGARRRSASGCSASGCPSTPAGDKSPGHPELDPFWTLLAETRTPFVLHIGAGSRVLPQEYTNFGKPRAPDLHGGGENLRFKDYVVLPHSAEMFLARAGLRRPVRPPARAARRRDRVRRLLGARVPAPDGHGRAQLRPHRPLPAGAVGQAVGDHPPAGEVHAVPRRGRRLPDPRLAAPTSTCSPATIRTRRAPTTRSAASSARSSGPGRGRPRAVLREELRADDGRARDRRWPDTPKSDADKGRTTMERSDPPSLARAPGCSRSTAGRARRTRSTTTTWPARSACAAAPSPAPCT